MKACSNDRMKFRRSRGILWMVCLISSLAVGNLFAQEDTLAVQDEVQLKPVKYTFESIWLIDAQTVMVPVKGTFEADFQHRFGTWNNGYEDFYGVFASSNIRLGVDYVPVDRLLIGLGFTKFNNLWDFYGKYAILKQMQGGGSPVSLDYYINVAIDTRENDTTLNYSPNFSEFSDRVSFFHQIMVARKITDDLSLQVSGNLSWFNRTEVFDASGEYQGTDQNAHFSASALLRYKFSNALGVILEYDQPIKGNKEQVTREPNLSFGLELTTSAHAFQLFIGNFQSLVPQYNHTYNTNNFGDNEILVGFNITRLWNF